MSNMKEVGGSHPCKAEEKTLKTPYLIGDPPVSLLIQAGRHVKVSTQRGQLMKVSTRYSSKQALFVMTPPDPYSIIEKGMVPVKTK